jgi:hypothetical protein
VVGFLLGYLEERSNYYLINTFGRKAVLFTAWIGTPIHELGHAIMCLLFRHKITKIKLLQLNDPNGVLGYVQHTYNPRSIYQKIGTFFIGLAPVCSGIVAIMGSMYLLVPQSYEVFHHYLETKVHAGQIDTNGVKTMILSTFALFESLFTLNNVMNPSFWLFIFVAISISSHIALSKEDIAEAYHGMMMLFALLVLLNIILPYFGVDSHQFIEAIGKYNVYIWAFSSVAILFSLITFGSSYLLYRLKSR